MCRLLHYCQWVQSTDVQCYTEYWLTLNLFTHNPKQSLLSLQSQYVNSMWNPIVCCLFIVMTGRRYVCAELKLLTGLLFIHQIIHKWIWRISGMILTGKNQENQRKTCPSTTLTITNFPWTTMGVNSGIYSEKLLT